MGLVSRIKNLATTARGKAVVPPGARIGEGVWIGRTAKLDWSHGRHLVIEDDATIVDGVRILCHDASSYRRTGITWVAGVCVRRGAFIGADSLLMPGVTVGEQAIVAAGSVVTSDVEPGAIVAGVPARVIGTVADLDARRLREMESRPVFDQTDYKITALDGQRASELDRAAGEGGYFMATPETASAWRARRG
ncbi:MAG: acyltransferase [Coriobacteriales bacterium]|nr:acyltransferase [Coriobacteriales bacterium]